MVPKRKGKPSSCATALANRRGLGDTVGMELRAWLVALAGIALASVSGVCTACGGAPPGSTSSQPGSPQTPTAQPTPTHAPGQTPATLPTVAAGPGPRCEVLPFAKSSPVPEASGAASLAPHAPGQIVVVSDSGNHGAFAIIDATSGETMEQGTLPLGAGASDDIEGLSMYRDQLVGLTSSGWIRVWAWQADAMVASKGRFALVGVPYALGEVTQACPGTGVNCGPNYEGLCLRHGITPPGACAGFAASKKTGALMCIVENHGRLALDPSRVIDVARSQALADCAFSPDDRALWVGNNAFGAFVVKRLETANWLDSRAMPDAATLTLESMGPLGAGFPEALLVAAGPDASATVYRFSDTSNAPSMQWRFQCR